MNAISTEADAVHHQAPITVLGCPRSGTNLLFSLLRSLSPALKPFNEPFSMNVRWVLLEDGDRTEHGVARLRCRCQQCFICKFRRYALSRSCVVKETALFEYLDVMVEEFNFGDILYIERDMEEVLDSYSRHRLGERWRLHDRRYFDDSTPDRAVADRGYARALTERKRQDWETKKHLVRHLELSYEYLTAQPEDAVAQIGEFMGRAAVPRSTQVGIANRIEPDFHPNESTYGVFH